MVDILNEFEKLAASIEFFDVDKTLVQKHIAKLSDYADSYNLAVTIQDLQANKTVYKSELYLRFFDNDEAVHPDDLDEFMRGALVAYKYFLTNRNKFVGSFQFMRCYRKKVNGEYKVVEETILPLEFDSNGNIWLSFDVINISPNQSQPHRVLNKLFNSQTGDSITVVTDHISDKPILSQRELEVLRLIDKGFLSKEIAEQLSISVHTVNTHRQRILEKLKVDTSIEAIRYAYNLGVL